jgi:hypothetical protein
MLVEQQRWEKTEKDEAGIQGWHGRDMTLLDDQAADDQGHRIRHAHPPREHSHQCRTEQEQGELTSELLSRLLEHFGSIASNWTKVGREPDHAHVPRRSSTGQGAWSTTKRAVCPTDGGPVKGPPPCRRAKRTTRSA